MHWITNTEKLIGLTMHWFCGMTCGENLSLFDELNLLDAFAKRMWTDIENKNYKNTFSVGMDCKRSGTEQEKIVVYEIYITNEYVRT